MATGQETRSCLTDSYARVLARIKSYKIGHRNNYFIITQKTERKIEVNFLILNKLFAILVCKMSSIEGLKKCFTTIYFYRI